MNLFRIAGVISVLGAASCAWNHHPHSQPDVVDAGYTQPSIEQSGYTAARRVPASDTIYFAPTQNLERLDLSLIDHARSSLTIAMYAFTDRTIAERLVEAARRGVKIRIYRDRRQFEQEQERGDRVSAILAGEPGIEVRIKGSTDLMHEKAMLVDDQTLRDGSGNWSVSAYRYQDNQVSVTHDRGQIAAFERDFNAMWSRSDNTSLRIGRR